MLLTSVRNPLIPDSCSVIFAAEVQRQEQVVC